MKKIKLDNTILNDALILNEIKKIKILKQNEYAYIDIINMIKNFFEGYFKDIDFSHLSPIESKRLKNCVYSFIIKFGTYSVFGEMKKIKDEFYLTDLKSFGSIKENYVFIIDKKFGCMFSRSYDVGTTIPKF